MKALLVLFAMSAIKYCHLAPHGGIISGGFSKHAGFAVAPAPSPYAEGSVDVAGGAVGGVGGGAGGAADASGSASFSASFGGGGGGGGGGGIVKTVSIEKHPAPVSSGYVEGVGIGGGGGGIGALGGASFSASFGGGVVGKHAHGGRVEVVSEKILDVATEAPPPALHAKKTVIERTYIPNYVEKKIQVPTYVEKTIRVPAYVEKTIKVPAAPTILEKTISQEEVPAPIVPKEQEVKVKVRPQKVYHKEVLTSGGGGGAGYFGGADYIGGGGYAGAARFGGAGGGGGGGFQAYASGGGGSLFDSIFDIPIQTLGAVRGFLNGLSGNISARGGFSKGFATY